MKVSALLLSTIFLTTAMVQALPREPGHPQPTPSDPQKKSGHEHVEHALPHTRQDRPPLNQLSRPDTTSSANQSSPDDLPQLPLSSTFSLQNQPQAVASCSSNDFASRSGRSLLDFIRQAPTSCVNDLFSLTGSQAYYVFRESQMVSVANEVASLSPNYQGNNNQGMEQLILFLRAGYYVQYYHSSDVGNYGNNMKTAIRRALDGYFSSPGYPLSTDDHGAILREAITLIDSAGENARYLYIVKDMLSRFNQDYASSWYMRAATNSNFTVLFRGHYNSDFENLILSDTSILNSLTNFISAHDYMIGQDGEFLLNNAARELGRFLQHSSIHPQVRPKVKSLINQYSINNGPGIWAGAAEMADYYDSANCQYYGVCNFKQQLATQVLPISHNCSTSVRIRAQQMSASELQQSCDELSDQEAYFHNKLQTNQIPVADDYNDQLEIVVFDSSDDYSAYSGILFGNDTNNGGIYLEGDPSDSNNTARFIAYEATWLPDFQVWNLSHEYVHYLDGRFNMKGNFSDYLTADTVWWLEGFAEYIDKKNDNDAAINLGRNRQFYLSTIFRNTYNDGSDRVYRWGYLAVRFLYERQPQVINSILQYFRAGNYSGYTSYLNARLTQYDSEWMSWLLTVQSTDDDDNGNPPPPPPAISELQHGDSRVIAANNASDAVEFRFEVPAGTASVEVKISGGSGDADLYVRRSARATDDDWDYRPWQTGNEETVTITTPQTGTWYIRVAPYNTFSNVTLSLQIVASDDGNGGGTTVPDQCANQSGLTFVPQLQNETNMVVCIDGSQQVYGYFYVADNVSKVTLKTGNGSGETALYYQDQGYPTTSQYDRRVDAAGADETLVINNPTANSYHHFLLSSGHSGTSLQLLME